MDYSARVKWVEGWSHLIADALSRAPLPIEKGDGINYIQVVQSLDTQLDELRNAASKDEAYSTLTETFKTRSATEVKRLPASHPAAAYKAYWDELSLHSDGKLLLYQSDHIVVPTAERASILELLHCGPVSYTHLTLPTNREV